MPNISEAKKFERQVAKMRETANNMWGMDVDIILRSRGPLPVKQLKCICERLMNGYPTKKKCPVHPDGPEYA